jgi:tetratricopeptide (TPR) repeat protein
MGFKHAVSFLAVALPLQVVSLQVMAEPLVGSTVGNADTIVSEASRLYNKKQFAKSAELYLKATRVNPSTLNTYLQLGRASVLAGQLQRGCYAYRVYLKASPDSPDRKKAAAEAEQCELKLKNAPKQPPDPSPVFVERRATFFAQLDKGAVLGPQSASEELRLLVKEGFLGPELFDMAQKLGQVAVAEAEGVHKRALANERVTSDSLRSARPLFQVATDCGVSAPNASAVTAFLDGLAEFSEKSYKKAAQLFADAAKADPSNKEYAFYRGLTLYQSGDRLAALKALETDLKDDPRTAVLRTSVALGNSPEVGAAEVERLLFSTRFPPEK